LSIQEYEEIQSEIDALLSVVADLRARANEALARHHGLVPGVSILHHDGITGTFLEVLNLQHGVTWVAVRVVTPDSIAGQKRHFYGQWEKVR